MELRPLLVAALVALSLAATSAAEAQSNYYRNSDGHMVRRPHGNWHTQSAAAGATALCGDGTFSHSEHPSAPGTCSYHGGVYRYAGRSAQGSSFTPRARDPKEIPIPNDVREIPLK